MNDPAVNRLTPIASLTKTTYQTEEEAIEAVNQVLDLQGDEIDLGYDITGYLQVQQFNVFKLARRQLEFVDSSE